MTRSGLRKIVGGLAAALALTDGAVFAWGVHKLAETASWTQIAVAGAIGLALIGGIVCCVARSPAPAEVRAAPEAGHERPVHRSFALERFVWITLVVLLSQLVLVLGYVTWSSNEPAPLLEDLAFFVFVFWLGVLGLLSYLAPLFQPDPPPRSHVKPGTRPTIKPGKKPGFRLQVRPQERPQIRSHPEPGRQWPPRA